MKAMLSRATSHAIRTSLGCCLASCLFLLPSLRKCFSPEVQPLLPTAAIMALFCAGGSLEDRMLSDFGGLGKLKTWIICWAQKPLFWRLVRVFISLGAFCRSLGFFEAINRKTPQKPLENTKNRNVPFLLPERVRRRVSSAWNRCWVPPWRF